MTFHLLSIVLLLLNVAQYKFESQYNNGIGQMREIQAYDDLRMLASRNIKQDLQTDMFMESLFANLTQGVAPIMLSMNKKTGGYEAEQYANIVLKVTERIIKTSGANSYENFKIPQKYCQTINQNQCDAINPYRSFDGTCNNLKYPWWGAVNTPYKRLLRADYDDGIGAMKQLSVDRKYYLPNARLVATTLHRPWPTKSVWSNYAISFGQTMAHDLAFTYGARNPDGTQIWCECNSKNEHCFNIPIPANDPFYNNGRKLQCYPFTRNQASVKDYDCNYGQREQLNRHSHFLDLRFVYGNGGNRLGQRGYLKFSVNWHGEVTFPLKNPNGCPYGKGEIYHTGDENGEQNVYLTGAQNIWLRNHNQIAEALYKINYHWDDETLYQQARRINIAMYQHVVYNEYLPQLIGPYVMRVFDLEPLTWGYYNKYNPDLYPQLLNEFVTAAYRHHFLVNHQQCWADEKLRMFGCHDLKDGMRNSSHMCWSADEVIRGQIAQPAYHSSPQLSFVMNNLLLHKPNSIGVLNIQRGRDHGLRSYNHYRELCGLNRAKTFDELYNIPAGARNQLKELYYSVDDIDLWSGGVAELPLKDAYIGHTFSCIIGKQFQDLKRGDRFYYEHGNSDATRFTPEQLNVIRSTSLASIICRNVNTQVVTKWPFLIWDPKANPFVNCRDYKTRVSLGAWKEVKY